MCRWAVACSLTAIVLLPATPYQPTVAQCQNVFRSRRLTAIYKSPLPKFGRVLLKDLLPLPIWRVGEIWDKGLASLSFLSLTYTQSPKSTVLQEHL